MAVHLIKADHSISEKNRNLIKVEGGNYSVA